MSPMGYAGVTYTLNTITRSPSSRRPSRTNGSPSPRSTIRTGAGTLSLRNDKVRRSSSPTNPQNQKSVRGNLLLHNNKLPPSGPRPCPTCQPPEAQIVGRALLMRRKKTFSKAAPPGVLCTRTPSAGPVAMSAWVEGVCRYVPTNSY